MSNQRDKLSDQIRQAVDGSGMSRYRICKLMGIGESTMSKFMAGAWLGRGNMDALAELLGLSIAVDRPPKPKTRRKG